MSILNISCKSLWKKGDKKCIIYSTKGAKDKDYTFTVRGYNPLPCKTFTGSCLILVNWLIENGWERDISRSDYAPDWVQVIVD